MSEHIHVAMMNLLWPRNGLERSSFYNYWSGAHTQISSRLPGIHQYFQHHLDAERGQLFPGAVGLLRDNSHPGFFGDAEITFADSNDLAAFAAALAPLMNDEQNVFQKTISYQAQGQNVATIKDITFDDSPNGDLGTNEKYLLYLQRDRGIDDAQFRTAARSAAELFASSSAVSKVRYRLLDPYDNDAVTLLAPNVSNHEPDESQLQGSIEVVFDTALSRRRFGASSDAAEAVRALAAVTSVVYPLRALRTYTVYNHGRITLAGLRTPEMAAQILALGAVNQIDGSTRDLILAEHPQSSSAQR